MNLFFIAAETKLIIFPGSDILADTNRIIELQQEITSLRISDWFEKVFSFQWFFMVFLLVVPWIIWWKFVNRKHIAEIFSFGLLITATSSFFNGIGLHIPLWTYPYKLLPYTGSMYMPSYSVLPVAFMLLYQYFRTWKSFAAANVIMAAIFAFILQPFLKLLGMYNLINWSYVYSFLIYIVMGLGLRLLLRAILQKSLVVSDNKEDAADFKKINFASPAFKKITDRLDDNLK